MSTDATYRRIHIQKARNDVTVVTFVDRKILDAANIHELGEELFALVDNGHVRLVLDFRDVEFMSGASLNKLIILDKSIKGKGGKLKLCSIRLEIMETFVITRLSQLFDIKDKLDDALAEFEC